MYRITVYLEVTPLGRDHVRIYMHPFRKYVFGKASKIQYLTRRVRSRFMPELDEALCEARPETCRDAVRTGRYGLAVSGPGMNLITRNLRKTVRYLFP